MSYGGRPLNSVRQNKNIIPLLRDVAQVNKKRREAYNLEKQKKHGAICILVVGLSYNMTMTWTTLLKLSNYLQEAKSVWLTRLHKAQFSEEKIAGVDLSSWSISKDY